MPEFASQITRPTECTQRVNAQSLLYISSSNWPAFICRILRQPTGGMSTARNYTRWRDFLEWVNGSVGINDDVSHDIVFDESVRHYAADFALLSVIIFCLSLTLLSLRGFMRIIFALKAIFIALALCIELGHFFGLYHNIMDQEIELERTATLNVTVNLNESEYLDEYELRLAVLSHEALVQAELKLESTPSLISGYAIDDWLAAFFSHMEEGMTFILFYEMYMCTCALKMRALKWKTLSLKVLLIALIEVVARALHLATMKIVNHFTKSEVLRSVESISPFQLLSTAAFTAGDAYLAVNIFIVLSKSSQFRQQNGSGSRASNGPFGLVVVLLFAQTARFGVNLWQCIHTTISDLDTWHCLASEESMSSGDLYEIGDCEAARKETIVSYLVAFYCGFFEFAFLFGQVSRKYISKLCQPEQGATLCANSS